MYNNVLRGGHADADELQRRAEQHVHLNLHAQDAQHAQHDTRESHGSDSHVINIADWGEPPAKSESQVERDENKSVVDDDFFISPDALLGGGDSFSSSHSASKAFGRAHSSPRGHGRPVSAGASAVSPSKPDSPSAAGSSSLSSSAKAADAVIKIMFP